MTDFAPAVLPGSPKVRIGYLFAGVVIGALWVNQGGTPLWEHAARLLGLMAIVMTVTTVRARLRNRPPKHPIGRFLAAKVGVVVLAVLAALLIGGRIDNEDMWIGLGLFVLVAVFGPILHPWLIRAERHELQGASA